MKFAMVCAALALMGSSALADDNKACPVPAPLLTKEEAMTTIQLMDLAVKSAGLSVAGNADFLARKLQPIAAGSPAKDEK